MLDNLWRQTLSAYLDSPLSPLFKEKLNALLSRFCDVPYCLLCHSCALRSLGVPPGAVLALLESPPAPPAPVFDRLPVPSWEEAAAPAPGSPLEQTLLACASPVFLGESGAEPARRGLREHNIATQNCGQEPGLIRRAGLGPEDAGRVEELPPTGPVLGTFAGVTFAERCVTLAPGDALVLFTDGLTEAGPDHTDMLGIEGVTALLAAPRPHGPGVSDEDRAEDFLLCLIAGVDRYAQAGVRDDVCILVAVVEGCGPGTEVRSLFLSLFTPTEPFTPSAPSFS